MADSKADRIIDRVVGWTTDDTLAVINRGPGAKVSHTKIEITGSSQEEVMAIAEKEIARLGASGIVISRHSYLVFHHQVK